MATLPKNDQFPVLIIGAGLSGLGCAYGLGDQRFLLAEANATVGGHARTHRRDGYAFDLTGHWLHLRDQRSRELLAKLFATDDWHEVARDVAIYYDGRWVAYPFQANLGDLSPELCRACLQDWEIATAQVNRQPPTTFHAYLEATFGRAMSEAFFIPYNQKLWGIGLEQLDTRWMSRFLPVPTAEQIRQGASGSSQRQLGYNAQFLVHREGGIDHLPRALYRSISQLSAPEIALETSLVSIDLKRQTCTLAGPNQSLRTVEFEQCISTMPLPELLRRIVDLPAGLQARAKGLRGQSWRYLDIALRKPGARMFHWLYVPEPRFDFFRVGSYAHANPAMAPLHASSLYVELSDRAGPLDLPKILRDLCELQMISSLDDVVFVEERFLANAYVIFDEHRARVLQEASELLAEHHVTTCGRYGQWTYNSMEDCLLLGLDTADKLRAGELP